jgi:putative membrane protein
MGVHDLPLLNAALNPVAAALLVVGHAFARRGRVDHHRLCMGAALVVSGLFLGSYVVYHLEAGSVRFTAPGWPRIAYYAILFTHVPLAAAILPLALVTAARGYAGRIPAHIAIARWTWPVWLYVSITGVLIYLMLYQWFPSSEIK